MNDVITAPAVIDPALLSRTDTGTRPARTWPDRLRPLSRPAGYFLASRVGVFFAALVAKWLFPALNPIKALGTMWDGTWYLKIAAHGYPAHLVQEGDGSRWAYFPAWPATIRGTSAVTGLSLAHAAVVLAFVFGLTSTIAIWLAVREIFGTTIADRSVLFYVFFPMAFVLSMAYTEALFLTAAGGCLYAMAKRYWVTAALFAAVGSLTRDVGVFLILAVVVAAVLGCRHHLQRRALVAAAISPVGLLGFMAYAWYRVGTPIAFVRAEKFWHGAHFLWFTTAPAAVGDIARSGLRGLTLPAQVLAAVALVFAYVGITLLLRMRRSGVAIPIYWWIFTVGALLTAFSPYSPNSILRYSMAAFPLFVALAWRLKSHWDGALIGVMACAQGALTMVVLVGVVHTMIPISP